MPDTAPGPQTGDLCGASTRGICLDDDKPPLYLGPCVLRKDHDGLIHQTADGARWMGDVGSAPTIPPRPDVPDELLDIAERAWNEFAKTAPVGLYDHDNIRRHILAAVIPAIEQRMREEAAAHADAIEAARDRWCLRAQQAEAAVQRVRDLANSLHDGVLVRRFLAALDQPKEAAR